MVECDLFALAVRALWRRYFCFAVAVRRAATFGSSKHKVLFARDAAAPDKSRQEQQRENRIGKGSAHNSISSVPTFNPWRPLLGPLLFQRAAARYELLGCLIPIARLTD